MYFPECESLKKKSDFEILDAISGIFPKSSSDFEILGLVSVFVLQKVLCDFEILTVILGVFPKKFSDFEILGLISNYTPKVSLVFEILVVLQKFL